MPPGSLEQVVDPHLAHSLVEVGMQLHTENSDEVLAKFVPPMQVDVRANESANALQIVQAIQDTAHLARHNLALQKPAANAKPLQMRF